MNTVLDIILVRTTPTAESLLFAVFFWGAVALTVASFIPLTARWLTDRDLDDEHDDDIEFTSIDHGRIR
ncbi:membrane protein [Gordonia phage Herod]|uniref:Uncharacterized protein n=5 Tax=Nymphadoravirus TaxID=2169636 RepID=A0A142KAS8_9CAUD|nr:hypothetical protein SEA_NYMPHADORA_52 [Gordonia phage Nymphadora]YP_010652916.1 membrane protein [Gordonia phage Herod]AOE43907.1 hypothetical protein SEA_BATSTARR_51 [Gordonia phage BatStarr]QDP43331.1 hypothetical protein SEA_EVIARTO_52 [Gordonia phage Eviarto]QDP43412.1 hypothetical protein SEA_TIMTAM_52 [Gordonia phage TimTam]AMS03211.1 hypothetical protein SEA_NYMPHADORA_52 [Gordonia phage Nymphadora]QOP67352.1 membrane protein [Gordonia phage Herod]